MTLLFTITLFWNHLMISGIVLITGKIYFIDAFVEHKLEKVYLSSYSQALLDSHKTHLENEALNFLKGCQEHYQQSGARIARNHEIVKHEDSAIFQSMALKPLKLDIKEFFKQIEEIEKNCSMDEDLSKILPNSTNVQESMHSRYYMCGTANQSIIT
ncbi:7618_t:CDS:2, partial [Entrophospora sp. SA101]